MKMKSVFAIPCLFKDGDYFDPDDVFFVTFNTRDDEQALRLASCICGPYKAERSLVIINEKGKVIPFY
jgi:hypothetical protein